jgi:5S rRNA maturation endonuclease (ribonuclease M5)
MRAPASPQSSADAFHAVVEHLATRVTDGALTVLVEGEHDVAALAALGLRAQALRREPLYLVVERFPPGSRIELAMDRDAAGDALLRTLRADLTQRGVYVSTTLRDALAATPVRQFEHVAAWLGRRQSL